MKGLNISSFKKIKEDKHSATMQHKDGHIMIIAKAPLPAIQRKQLEKLPIHLADGTPDAPLSDTTSDSVKDSPEQIAADAQAAAQNQSTPADAPPINMAQPSDFAMAKGLPPDETPQPADAVVPAIVNAVTPGNLLPPTAAAPSNSALPDADPNLPGAGAPVGPTNSAPQNAGAPIPGGSPVDVNQAYAQGQKSISEQQDVASQLADHQAKIQQADLDARQDLNSTLQKNTRDFQAQQKQFMSDYMNNHIDPKHYMENMGSGQKVATGIGLFLGGFSSAFTHQGNPAMDFLNKQIDRDIAGQESRLGQQKTILGANQELFHDQMLANNATRINMNDIYDHKIQLAASQLGTPAAKAQADAAHSKFALENAQLLQQNALRATVLQSIHQSNGAGLEPAQLGQAGIIPEADAVKEQSAYLAKKAAIASGNQAYEDAGKQTVGQKLNPLNWHTGSALAVDQSTLANNLVAVAPTKRYSTEMAQALVQPFIPDRTDNAAQLEIKKQGYLNLIERESAGEMPLSSRYINKNAQSQQAQPQKPQYKVGDVAYVKGQKVQIINPKGDYKAVK